MKIRSIALFALALALCGCGTLDKSGPYGGDKTLYSADLVITSSYSVFDTFLQWENTNRAALLAVNPAIKKYADNIRANAKQWFSSAEALRDTYQANPTGTNAQNLTAAIAIIQTALAQAGQYIATTPTAQAAPAAPVTK